jgi:hypothetical protein
LKADGRTLLQPAASYLSPVVGTTGSVIARSAGLGFWMRPQLNGGTLGGPGWYGRFDH